VERTVRVADPISTDYFDLNRTGVRGPGQVGALRAAFAVEAPTLADAGMPAACIARGFGIPLPSE
jgi:hypothetical protein